MADYHRGKTTELDPETLWSIDDEVLETFRERSDSAGKGYQTMINEALRQYLEKVKQPIDEDTLRRVIQEELRAVRWFSVNWFSCIV